MTRERCDFGENCCGRSDAAGGRAVEISAPPRQSELCEHTPNEVVRVLARHRLPADQDSIVNRSDERFDHRIDVQVSAHLASLYGASERQSIAGALLIQILGTQLLGESAVVLRFSNQRTKNRPSVGTGKELRALVKMSAEVGLEITRVGRVQGLRRILQKRVQQDIRLRFPPAVDRLLADAGLGGDGFDRNAGESELHEHVVGRLQDSLPCRFAPTVAIAVVLIALLARDFAL
jgi:hypothetical protein